MSWNSLLGHETLIAQFRRASQRSRLEGSFLFVGPAGIGKRTFTFKLAQALLCEQHPESGFDPCGQCRACLQVAAQTHPDFEYIQKPADKSQIPVELLIGDREHRMREGICHRIALKPLRGKRKIAVIDDADDLNQEGANCLLKTLEEPPPKALIILIGTSQQRQLPTIRSRCRVVQFQPLTRPHVAQLLNEHQLIDSPELAEDLAALSAGSLQQAIELAEPEWREFRKTLLIQLSQHDPRRDQFNTALQTFVDNAGKEASLRRGRMRQIADVAVDFYRALLRSASGAGFEGDAHMEEAIACAQQNGIGQSDVAEGCLHRCLEVHAQIASNANQATLLECWLSDLGKLNQGQVLASG